MPTILPWKRVVEDREFIGYSVGIH